jgi:hypothetical protein
MTEKTKIRIKHDPYSAADLMVDVHEGDFGTFCAWHRRLNLGKLNGDKAREYIEDAPENALKIPVYIYQHSGIALSTTPFSCPWDSGQVGIWIFTSEDLVNIYGEDNEDNRAKALDGVSGQLKYMNDLGDGNVWGYEIEDFDGEVADSSWGFVGDRAVEDMKGDVPENLHASLQEAWENRFS